MATRADEAKMAECQWLKPVLIAQFEFLEWTADNHLIWGDLIEPATAA
jgi:hypothetical protein